MTGKTDDTSARDLLDRMSLDEKLAQLGSIWVTDLINENRTFDMHKAQTVISSGIGQIARIGTSSLLLPDKSAGLANAIQKFLVEHTRLGIPAMVHEEACAGYMARGATTFPQAIGLAATWDPDVISEMACVIRTQMRAVGAHHALAPVLDVARDPRWGRVEETFGEDPYLITQIGTAYIKGIQSEDLRYGVAATGKHFAGHGWAEGGRNWSPVRIPDREFREVFLTPFWAAIKEANVASIMNAYHELDGVPCGSSKELLVDLLRGEMGFDSLVVADYFTLDALLNYHRVAVDAEDVARLGIEAGIDIELPVLSYYRDPLRQAVESGKVDIALVNAAVERVLQMKFRLGLFENPYVDEGRVVEVYNTPEQSALSLKLAEESIVLLKNDAHVLPLSPTLTSIAVIGPSADSSRLLQGDYHYPSHLDGTVVTDADNPNPAQDLENINFAEHFNPSVSVLEGIKAALSPDTQVLYAQGCEINGDDVSGFEAAVAAAKQAQVAVVVVGGRSGLAKHCTCGETIDRANLDLPGVQQQLVEAIHATGTPVVVVLLNGRPYGIPWIVEHIPAIVEAWLPAQEGGTAIANVLFGKTNPGGKLPMTFPRSSAQLPLYYNHKPSGGRTHWQVDYIDMSVSPLFPFGHGLSYTDFAYSGLQISPAEASPTGTVLISVDVQNTGAVTGDEVVQLYLSDRIGSVTRPVKELKGFKRLTLQPGEKKTLTFMVPVSHLGFYNRGMEYVVEPGTVDVMLGSSSADIRVQGTFEITGQVTKVEHTFTTGVQVR